MSRVTDCGRLSALLTGRALLRRNIIYMPLVLISVRGRVNLRAQCGRKMRYTCYRVRCSVLDALFCAAVSDLNYITFKTQTTDQAVSRRLPTAAIRD
jgi:hypothetical protein